MALISAASANAETVLILFDASHSMGAFLYNKRKIEIARDGLTEVLGKLPTDTAVGLRLLAHEESLNPCAVTTLAVAPAVSASERVRAAVKGLAAKGTETPLARALRDARQDLSSVSGSRRVVMLTDGIETCQGDPVQEARDLGKLGVKVDVVGIGPERRVPQFEAIATAGGGSYVQARSNDGMRAALAGLFGPPPTAASTTAGGPTDAAVPSSQSARGTKSAAPSGSMPISASVRPLAVDLEVILDSSGSMAGAVAGDLKLALARKALAGALQQLAGKPVMVAFRAYGHRVPRDDKTKSCGDTELLEPFDLENRSPILERAAALKPLGQTPIALSLEAAAADLRARSEFRHFILLLSDGIETCGGDPVAVASRLRAEGFDVVIHTVGFDVDDEAERQLKAIAAATGGQFFRARDYSALADSLATVVADVDRTSSRVESEKERNPVMGGPTAAAATALGPGRYTLAADLPQRTYTYFKIPLRSGQLLTYTTQVTSFVGTQAGSIAAAPLDEQGREIRNARATAVGEMGRTASRRIFAEQDRTIVLAVGSDYNRTHRDSRFDVRVDDCFDGEAGRDAPADGSMLFPSAGLTAFLGLEDLEDRFRLGTLSSGKRVTIVFEPEDPRFAAQLRIQDSGGKPLASSGASAAGRLTLAVNVPATGGPWYVTIRDRNVRSEQRLTRYRLSLSQ